MLAARDYQRGAADAVYEYWNKPDTGNGLIVVPTAGGKSFIMALLIKEIQEKWPGTRILILTHVQELIEQDYDELLGLWPEAPAGIFSSGLGRKELQSPILFASIQSIEKHAHRLDPPAEIVFVDEAHLIPRNEQTRYIRTLSLLSTMYRHLRVLGLTATPYRLDSGWLHKGEGAIFQDIIYNIDPQYLIDQGFLSPVHAKVGSIEIDLGDVHKRGGEYISGELEAAAMKGDTTAVAVADILQRGASRKKGLIFTTGIKHAEAVLETIINEGIPADMITGSTPKLKRKTIVEEFKTGQIKYLVNVDVLTTGFNCRDLDLIAMLRPTGSPSLHVQMIGRGMRTAPGKTDCLVLDYAGNCVRHGPIDAISPEAPGQGEGVAPAKVCPECGSIIAAGFRICPSCGHEFPEPEQKIAPRPIEAPILKSQIEPEKKDVLSCYYRRHKKEGKKDSVCIEYSCGIQVYKEWVFPEAESPKMAFYYGKFMAGAGIPYENWPRNVYDFLNNPPKAPSSIWMIKEGKFDRIMKREYLTDVPVETEGGIIMPKKERYDMAAERLAVQRAEEQKVYDDIVPF